MARVVRVLTDVAPLERGFDYLAEGDDASLVGERVRVTLGHRRVRGWVIDAAVAAPEVGPGDLRPIVASLGWGPPPAVVDLARWAAHRWCAPWSFFMSTASPKRLVRALPPVTPSVPASHREAEPPGVVQTSPTTDPLELVLSAEFATRAHPGTLLVVVPHEGWAGRLAERLARRGLAVTGADEWERARSGWPVVVGTRAAAFAPSPRLRGAVVLDADDDALRSSAAPTWDAVAVVRERCRREGVPLWATSMLPSPRLLDRGGYRREDDVAGGWPVVEVVDRRGRDPHEGALSAPALAAARRALEGDEAVAVAVLHQRLGRGRLLACRRCRALVRCPECGRAESESPEGLVCASGHGPRPRFCLECGSTALVGVRSGVTTLARDVAAQLRVEVAEVSGTRQSTGDARVVVGTEALFTPVRRAGLVVVFDADQYLLAPRESARRQLVLAVGRAGRLVGARRDGRGSVVVQTRRGDDPVLEALAAGRFDAIVDEEVDTARLLGLAPFGAEAHLSGEHAGRLADELAAFPVEVRATREGYLVRASDVATLTDALAASPSRRDCRVAVA